MTRPNPNVPKTVGDEDQTIPAPTPPQGQSSQEPSRDGEDDERRERGDAPGSQRGR